MVSICGTTECSCIAHSQGSHTRGPSHTVLPSLHHLHLLTHSHTHLFMLSLAKNINYFYPYVGHGNNCGSSNTSSLLGLLLLITWHEQCNKAMQRRSQHHLFLALVPRLPSASLGSCIIERKLVPSLLCVRIVVDTCACFRLFWKQWDPGPADVLQQTS